MIKNAIDVYLPVLGTIDPDVGPATDLGLPFTLVLDRGAQALMLYQSSAAAPTITISDIDHDKEEEEERDGDEDAVTFYKVKHLSS